MRLLHDIRYAWGLLAKNRGLTAAAICSLALGMGVTTIIFGIASSLTRPVSQKNPKGWVTVRIERSTANRPLRYADYLALAAQSRAFADIAFAEFSALPLAGAGNPEMISALVVSPNYLSALGANPIIGQAGSGDPNTVVLSHGYWNRRFAADPRVLGKKLVSSSPRMPDPLTIIGVAPLNFHPTLNGVPLRLGADLFIPIQPLGRMREKPISDRTLLARLRAGVNPAQAQIETENLLEQLGVVARAGARPQVRISRVRSELPDVAVAAVIFQCLFGLVLLTGCANAANLLLARNEERRTEIAVRLALGASRGQLARQLLTESVVLSIAAVPVALALALSCIHLIGAIRLQGGPMELSLDLQVDYSVFGFALLVSLIAGILSGLLPVRAALRADVHGWLKEQSASGWARGKRVRACLVSAQIAISLVSLCTGAMFLRGLSNLTSSQLGFRPDIVIAGQLLPGLAGYEPARTTSFRRALTERLRRAPGIQAVSASSGLPLTDGGFSSGEALNPGSSLLPKQPRVAIWYNSIAPDYFPAMGIPLLQGRDFSEADLDGGAVAIATQAMAQQFWPGENPLGKVVHMASPLAREYRIVGILRTQNTGP
jgi:predicted permease